MSRNVHIWLPEYVRQSWQRRAAGRRAPVGDVYVCVADHYEPYWGGADAPRARARVERWCRELPSQAGRHRDSDGRHPQHTFFYPAEEYDERLLESLAQLCRDGFGDVELHLHHDNDTAEQLERTLLEFKRTLHDRHGLLRTDPHTGQIVYAFIHGNWALDNSRPDGRWCGVDNEIEVLVRTGCRVDMTLPSAPSPSQTRKVNSIYFARGRPCQRKGHDGGRDVAVGTWGDPHELLLIQGPLMLNWERRKGGLLPRIENGELSADNPPTADRVRLWGQSGIGVRGAERHLFVKVHTHGAQEATMEMLLGGGLERMWSELETQFGDIPGCRLHYLSAWEMYSKVRQLALHERAA